MDDLPLARRRTGVRRSVRSACRAMAWSRFEVIGEQLLDLSPTGALLACEGELRVGDEILLGFRMPWLGPDVLVNAEVARVIPARREGDPCTCVGLRFLDLEPDAREELRARLEPFEPTAPARSHPIDYALAVRMIEHRTPAQGVLEG